MNSCSNCKVARAPGSLHHCIKCGEFPHSIDARNRAETIASVQAIAKEHGMKVDVSSLDNYTRKGSIELKLPNGLSLKGSFDVDTERRIIHDIEVVVENLDAVLAGDGDTLPLREKMHAGDFHGVAAAVWELMSDHQKGPFETKAARLPPRFPGR